MFSVGYYAIGLRILVMFFQNKKLWLIGLLIRVIIANYVGCALHMAWWKNMFFT